MASDNDRDNPKGDDLAGLFSTRATQHRPLQRSLIGDTRGTSSGVAARPASQSVTQPSTGQQGASVRSSSVTSADLKGMRGHLSAVASTVLREARRELSNDYNIQGEGDNQLITEQSIAASVDKVIRKRGEQLDDIERANVIIHLQKDLMGWGVLQPLIDNKEVTDIHCYDYQTVVLQRGKMSETTGIHWPSQEAYVAFIDRLLMRMGRSLSTQQHTVDASLPNGTRICCVHESVCGSRGPLLTIRVPRLMETSLESLITYQVAPPLIVQYLASLTRSGMATMIVSGETGTGKTTLLKCLGTQFRTDESIIAVEDTPELNFQHPYFRSLVSRPANTEGVGEVTLQEHIKTTLRLTPTRVILGEMRTPYAAEAFLESAQTGHVGFTTVHARNARETLVRLESLLGRAQKSVSLDIIRQQIALAVDTVVWLIREKGTGKPRVAEVIEVGNFVEGTIQVRPMFTLAKQGERPVWRVDSWTSAFDEYLGRDGVFLGDAPPEIGFGNLG